MNIKSLLIGSAAALAAVSGAQAADAIVAAEPEPMEYVRVCDAFGTGYFYIPGTETCLQISGYVRFQADFKQDGVTETRVNPVTGLLESRTDDGYKAFSRGYISLDAKSDTELGTLTGHIDIQADSDGSGVELDGAWLQLGGFRAGWFYGYWDKGINGETDLNDSGFGAIYNAVSYTYEAGSFSASAALETFNQTDRADRLDPGGWANNGSFSKLSDDWGISAQVSGAFGAVSADLLASYDFDAEEAAIRGLISADLGPGQLQAFAVWASGANRYWNASEWSIAASYKAQINEKFSITPGAQYFGNLNPAGFGTDGTLDGDFLDDDGWKAGVTLDYEIVKDLTTKVSVQYEDLDTREDSNWSGFVRLQRSF
ncbi:porin [Sinorhizobium sp. RAC02]|uniref:porin n=1 Tax=Sinorhizobium sp. RAC02 TaxID=1842534 RepID=UPI00083DCF04|nr:porin [Sinorhizobium sp. RAC02]AOF92039.1 porin subfamily protein [Sinorhizobium sp. RAC02]